MIAPLLLQTKPQDWITEHVIVLDWYDGPRCGLCRLRFPEAEFYFDLLAERATEDDLNDRLFSISELSNGTISEILRSQESAGHPASSICTTPNEAADAAVDRAIQVATKTSLVIRTPNFVEFLGVWEIAPPTNPGDWFALLEAAGPLSQHLQQ